MTARTPTTAYPMTIFHKPNCSTSRNVLGLIRESGVEPEIVLYLETPPSKKKLRELAKAMGMSARELLRLAEVPVYQNKMFDTASAARGCPRGDLVLAQDEASPYLGSLTPGLKVVVVDDQGHRPKGK